MPITNQGITKQQYKVVPRTLLFLFDEYDRVLLLKGSSQKKRWAGLFNGIGGHIEAGEDVMEAALRELDEEASITGVDLEFCGQFMIDTPEDIGIALFVFRGKYPNRDRLTSRDGELVWIPLEEIGQYPILEDLQELLPRVAAFKRGSPLIIGNYTFDAGENLKISIRY